MASTQTGNSTALHCPLPSAECQVNRNLRFFVAYRLFEMAALEDVQFKYWKYGQEKTVGHVPRMHHSIGVVRDHADRILDTGPEWRKVENG
jgi:hypothetical protein